MIGILLRDGPDLRRFGVSSYIIPKWDRWRKRMFADSLLESAPHLGHRSAWMKLASVILQSLALAVALAIPLFHIEHLQVIPSPPGIRLTNSAPAAVHTETLRPARNAPTESYVILQPISILGHARRVHDVDQGATRTSDTGPICTSNCGTGGVAISELIKPGLFNVPPPPPVHGPVHVSEMQLGELVRKVIPEYPIAAKQLHIQGQVLLTAMVGKDGRVQHVTPLSGPPLLILSAKRAVEQWRYRPYLLNHEPVEVQTQITVNFVLNSQ